MQALNPGWRHVLHDDTSIQRFVQEHYSESVLATYKSINPLYGAARADVFRYLPMLQEGGVYLDVKSGCSRPLSRFIQADDELLLARWNNQPGECFEGWGMPIDEGVPSELQSWHIVCRPGHPLLKAAVDAVLHNLRTYTMRAKGVGKFGVLGQHAHRFIDSHAAGLVYAALTLPPGQASHMGLFKQHYTRVKMPLVSSGPQSPWHYARYPWHYARYPWHYARYKAMRWLGMMA